MNRERECPKILIFNAKTHIKLVAEQQHSLKEEAYQIVINHQEIHI